MIMEYEIVIYGEGNFIFVYFTKILVDCNIIRDNCHKKLLTGYITAFLNFNLYKARIIRYGIPLIFILNLLHSQNTDSILQMDCKMKI